MSIEEKNIVTSVDYKIVIDWSRVNPHHDFVINLNNCYFSSSVNPFNDDESKFFIKSNTREFLGYVESKSNAGTHSPIMRIEDFSNLRKEQAGHVKNLVCEYLERFTHDNTATIKIARCKKWHYLSAVDIWENIALPYMKSHGYKVTDYTFDKSPVESRNSELVKVHMYKVDEIDKNPDYLAWVEQGYPLIQTMPENNIVFATFISLNENKKFIETVDKMIDELTSLKHSEIDEFGFQLTVPNFKNKSSDGCVQLIPSDIIAVGFVIPALKFYSMPFKVTRYSRNSHNSTFIRVYPHLKPAIKELKKLNIGITFK